ncbi:hypothetical protein M569_00410 [Genlisea aurea]|uniref:Uncharacterized protein n=1 Tax=Genlisea aurea TaxID=192259 RepID=S8EEH8_9LAMI|nr:hypothetical protein M569_00410 [Genlisea aurea]
MWTRANIAECYSNDANLKEGVSIRSILSSISCYRYSIETDPELFDRDRVAARAYPFRDQSPVPAYFSSNSQPESLMCKLLKFLFSVFINLDIDCL